MAKRQPPTVDEVYAALRGMRGNPLHSDRGIEWGCAVRQVKAALRTTNANARQWLEMAIQDKGSVLLAVHLTVLPYVMRDKEGWAALVDQGWSPEVARCLKFDSPGTLIAPSDNRRKASSALQWVLHRDTLEAMKATIEKDLALLQREQVEKRDRVAGSFRELHGDAADVVTSWLRDMFQDTPWHTEIDEIFEPSLFDWSKLYGSPGAIRLTFRGDQIEQLTEALRASTRSESEGP
jgi:hypothetical protein